MSYHYKRIAELILKLRRNAANAEELAELKAWSNESPANFQLVQDFLNDEWVSQEMQVYQQIDWNGHWYNLSRSIPVLQSVQEAALPMIIEEGMTAGSDVAMAGIEDMDMMGGQGNVTPGMKEEDWISVEAQTSAMFTCRQRKWLIAGMIVSKVVFWYWIWRISHRWP